MYCGDEYSTSMLSFIARTNQLGNLFPEMWQPESLLTEFCLFLRSRFTSLLVSKLMFVILFVILVHYLLWYICVLYMPICLSKGSSWRRKFFIKERHTQHLFVEKKPVCVQISETWLIIFWAWLMLLISCFKTFCMLHFLCKWRNIMDMVELLSETICRHCGLQMFHV